MAALAVLTLGACAPAGARVRTGVTVAISAPPPKPETTTPRSPEPCARVQAAVDEGIATFPELYLRPEPAACLAGERGAWGYVLTFSERVENGESVGWHGQAQLVYADAEGGLAWSPARALEVSAMRSRTATLETAVDLDLDGREELFVQMSESEFETNGTERGEVWRARGDVVEPYPPAALFNIAAFRDADRDGRPELVVGSPFRGLITECGVDGTQIAFGPEWLAHSLADGSFAYDAISEAVVRERCPAPPTPVVPKTPGGIDNDELRLRLACARAWGASAESVAKALTRACTGLAPAPECDYAGVLPSCVNLPRLLEWAAASPPFTVPLAAP